MRPLRLALLAAGLVALFVVAALVLLQAGPVQRELAQRLANAASAPGRTVSLEGLSGTLPFSIRLERATLADDKGVWLEAEDILLRWSPLALARGRVHVRDLAAGRIEISRAPLASPSEPSPPVAEPFRLPDLSPFVLDNLSVVRLGLGEELAGRRQELTVKGGLQPVEAAGGVEAGSYAVLDAASLPPAPETVASLKAYVRQGEDWSRLSFQLSARDAPDGLLAALSGLGFTEPVSLSLGGEGDFQTWSGLLDANVGGLGSVNAELGLRLAKPRTFTADGSARLSPALLPAAMRQGELPSLVEVVPFHLEAVIEPTGALALPSVSLKTGLAELLLRGRFDPSGDRFQAEYELREGKLAPLSALAGTPLAGAFTLEGSAQGTIEAPEAKAAIALDGPAAAGWSAKRATVQLSAAPLAQDGGSDRLRLALRGDAAVTELRTPEAGPAPEPDPKLRFEATLASGGAESLTLSLTSLELAGRVTTLNLRGGLSMAEGTPADLAASLKVESLAPWTRLVGQEIDGGLTADLSLQGRLAVGDIQAALTGAYRLPNNGGLSPEAVKALGQEVRFEAGTGLTGYQDGELTVRGLRVTANGSELRADATSRLAAKTFKADFKLDVERAAALIPGGAPLPGESGAVAMTGSAGGSFADFTLKADLEGRGLAWQGIEAQHFALDADLRGLPSSPNGSASAKLTANGGLGLDAKADFALTYPTLRLSSLAVNAAGNSATGQGAIDLQKSLADGELRARLDNLDGLGRLIGQELGGALTLAANLSSKDGRQDASVDLSGKNLRSSSLAVDGVTLNGALTDVWQAPGGQAKLAARGAVLGPETRFDALSVNAAGTAGRLDFQLSGDGRLNAPLTVSAKGSYLAQTPPGTSPKAKDADERAKKSTKPASKGAGKGSGKSSGKTALKNAPKDAGSQASEHALRLASLEGRYADRPFSLAQPATLTLKADGYALSRTVLRYAGGEIEASAQVDSRDADIQARVADLPLRALEFLGLPPLTGQLNASLSVAGPAGAPRAALEASAAPLRLDDPAYASLPAASLRAKATLADGTAEAEVQTAGYGENPLVASVRLPARLSAQPFDFGVEPQAPLSGAVRGDVSLAKLAGALPLQGQRLAGQLAVGLEIGGTLSNPSLTGGAKLADGRYENADAGTVLRNIQADVRFLGDHVELASLTADDGGQGRLTATGQVEVAPDRGFPYALRAEAKNAHLLRQRDADATVTGTASFEGNASQALLTGTFTVVQAEISLPEGGGGAASLKGLAIVELNKPAGRRTLLEERQADTGGGGGFVLRLNVVLNLPGRVYVRGRGLDSEWAGDLQVTGTANAPVISGALKVARGHFDFLDRRFQIERGVITFQGSTPPRPVLDISAQAEANDITAIVNVTGVADNPKIDISSNPALPQDEVLSRLLFGRSLGSITPVQAVGLARALAALSGRAPGGGPLDVIGNTRRFLGLEELEIRQTEDSQGGLGGAAVGVGKHLGENIYIRAQRGVDPRSGKVVLEIEITPNLSLESNVGETGAGGVGLNYKFDY